MADPETEFINNGAFAADFQDAIETTAFFGARLADGDVWKVKGGSQRSGDRD
jgi:hypothetical protein